MSVTGTFSDDWGFSSSRGEPLENTESTLFELRPAPDGKSVDVIKPPMTMKTSDPQSVRAVKAGLGDGLFDSLSKVHCNDLEDPQANRTVIDAQELIMGGFWVADSVIEAKFYRLKHAAQFCNNFDVVAEYQLSDGPIQVGYSVVLLPQQPMQPRRSDDRLLFFDTAYTDLGYRPAASPLSMPSRAVDRHVSMIWRYDLQRLPNRTIRVHVDPSVPERWREMFRQGIEAWNEAFAQLGEPNAVKGIVPGDADWPTDYSIADARFSTISWDLSDEVMSAGIAKVDPRSGEIVKSDITMSDGWVQSYLEDLDVLAPEMTHSSFLDQKTTPNKKGVGLLQQESHLKQSSKVHLGLGYRVERGRDRSVRSSPYLQRLNSSQQETVLGTGLRSIVMHEMGHILGLRHNFKGSMGTSLECIKNKSCTGQYGFSSSVMDYVPMNIPEVDSPDIDVFSHVVGEYDKLAIFYGYAPVKNASWPDPEPELQGTLSQAESFETCYDDDQSEEDPSCMAYDMSDDPIAYFEQEFNRLGRIGRDLQAMSVGPGEPYRLYGDAYIDLMSRAYTMSQKVVKWIGGIRNRYVHRSLDGAVSRLASRAPHPVETQRRAFALLLRMLRAEGLRPPEPSLPWLVHGSLRDDMVSSTDYGDITRRLQFRILKDLLSVSRVLQIDKQEHLLSPISHASSGGLSLQEVLQNLSAEILEPGLGLTEPDDLDLHILLLAALKELYLKGASAPYAELEAKKASIFSLANGSDRSLTSSTKGLTEPEFPARVNMQVLQQLAQVRESALKGEEALGDDQASQPRRAHLALVHRELSSIFCEPGELPCQTPRVSGVLGMLAKGASTRTVTLLVLPQVLAMAASAMGI
eukprot:TRINITY_DN8941_c0_g6_i1.p1 TRINITY_DN8941_c0_g6~~TRINITY_DN8941_c0_g6_i1.p1  ORF type:complete len:1006 (+),score=139.87 TRINITY_DN8941_c0_g6_i1:442-3018(+)